MEFDDLCRDMRKAIEDSGRLEERQNELESNFQQLETKFEGVEQTIESGRRKNVVRASNDALSRVEDMEQTMQEAEEAREKYEHKVDRLRAQQAAGKANETRINKVEGDISDQKRKCATLEGDFKRTQLDFNERASALFAADLEGTKASVAETNATVESLMIGLDELKAAVNNADGDASKTPTTPLFQGRAPVVGIPLASELHYGEDGWISLAVKDTLRESFDDKTGTILGAGVSGRIAGPDPALRTTKEDISRVDSIRANSEMGEMAKSALSLVPY
ncbi:hypothetical protein FS837_012555 [Tulasnella sp. UAMH 9824]|nr:hypothetical protein FS837_012555 [Tulasnella sp. UAMH 9824]